MPQPADPGRARIGLDGGAAPGGRRPRPGRSVQLAVVRAGVAPGASTRRGASAVYFASGRRPASSLNFRGLEVAESFTGFSDRPAYADARRIAERLMAAYVDGDVDRVEIFYNGYISPISQVVRRETLLPLQQATDPRGRARTRTHDDGRERISRRARMPVSERALGRVRARPRGDPPAARARLCRDLDLPCAAGVHRLRARRPDDGDAQRIGQRRRADRGSDPCR